jgi:hypothetical protein
MTYEKLYSDMVKKFTVEKDNKDYKLGEYMLMKAKAEKKNTARSLMPVSHADFSGTKAITAVFNYVSDKLTVREAPVRDKTIRRFPLRTSLTAFCSAVVVCALVFSYGLIGFKSINSQPAISDSVYTEIDEAERQDTVIGYTIDGENLT